MAPKNSQNKTAKTSPIIVKAIIEWRQPKSLTAYARTISPTPAPKNPRAAHEPATKAKWETGSHVAASFNAPTNANADPKPCNTLPSAAIQNRSETEINRLPAVHIKTAITKVRLIGNLSINIPTTSCIGV